MGTYQADVVAAIYPDAGHRGIFSTHMSPRTETNSSSQ
jgi:hypothetical protein